MMLEPTAESKTQVHFKRYVKHSKAVGISWAVLTCCFLIINIIVFIEPQWIGDTDSSPGTGWVGLYELCELVNSGSTEICQGSFQDFTTILTDAFRASTFFIGVSCLIIFLCILLFCLFLFCDDSHVFIVCGVLQGISTVFMFLGCVIFPHGWDNFFVKRICGDNCGRFNIGQCGMRWSYILAIIGIFDILILTVLAFVLAARQAEKITEYEYQTMSTKPHGNGSYVVDVVNPSKAGSVMMSTHGSQSQHQIVVHDPHHRTLSAAHGGGGPVYIVDDHHSEFSNKRKRRLASTGTNNGSEVYLIRDNSKSSSRKQQPDSRVRSGSF